MRLCYVVGARPNFVKMAPVVSAVRRRAPDWRHCVVHTEQHYDEAMSGVFIEQLGMPEPDHVLGVGSGTHAVQTARAMVALEPVLAEERPHLLVVAGDVNSTLAASLTAAKLQIPIAHVESGLRSFDRTMPEEHNRALTDRLSAILLVHCSDAVENLRREGFADDQVHLVGNTMIDSIVASLPHLEGLGVRERLGLDADYVLVTLHRPTLVDGPLLGRAMTALRDLAREIPVVFPIHPRTRKRLGVWTPQSELNIVDPLGYLEFLDLERTATAVVTDSGGIQEESTFLGVPCFTLRDNTERPVTVEEGTNTLLGLRPERLAEIPAMLAGGHGRPHRQLPGWDGKAGERAADVIMRWLTRADGRVRLPATPVPTSSS
ncbi:MAG TPA: UDP-N-acetylglucosamine 2-epimerase (non-hydrolyzing) [Thermoleophilaceae bacterium]|nr:UDP-N-acetylglucosamine 2-epimerase (non-hydrolyzing) [Thermoleophilaceae bacterium]